MSQLALFLSDDATPVEDIPSAAEAGQEGGVLELHLWNHQGDESGQEARNLLAAVRTESLTEPDVFLASGVPPQDELWWRMRIIGFDNRGDASWTIAPTAWRPLGAFSALEIDRIPADCAVYLEAKLHPPSTAAAGSWRHRFVFFVDEFAQPIPRSVGLLRRGILTGIGDRKHSGIVSGCQLTASDPPDDRVHVAAGMWVFEGAQKGKVRTEHVFDLTDGDGLALASGESFWALLELAESGGIAVTKGPKSITPQRPAQSLGELVLGWVKVEHDPSGVPVIDAVDLDVRLRYDRFHLEPGPGLSATLHPGQAIASSAWLYRAITTPLVLEASVINHVWLLPTGRPLVTSDEVAPDPAAVLLWEVETDGVAVVDVRDRRTYATASQVLTLTGELPAEPGEIDRLTVVDDRLFIERVVVDVPELGGGTTGETAFDVLANGVSIYHSSDTDDQRPRFPAGSGSAVHEGGIPELLELRRGDEIVVLTTAHADVPPERGKLQLLSWSG